MQFSFYVVGRKQEAAQKISKLPTDICGQSSDQFFERKVINGDPATLGKFFQIIDLSKFEKCLRKITETLTRFY